MNIDRLKKLNQLAKTLKETGMAPSMDDAVKMAEQMMHEGDKSIAELTRENTVQGKLISDAVHEDGFMDKVKERVKDLIGDVEEKLNIKEEEPDDIEDETEEEKEKFILKKPEQEIEEIQEQIKTKEE